MSLWSGVYATAPSTAVIFSSTSSGRLSCKWKQRLTSGMKNSMTPLSATTMPVAMNEMS
ncbi:hypothetical protein DPMN_190361 [Dreissena polymorpha]|uniref:Uncharacterized protein n=1 Tax=Dreissena polymorpha TaxID=45954 RepID=A0A9D4ID93_DREPO|nr:hypothetical protein DPMN_190361 [Dreissena polymorpha]